ncbi:MAG: arginine--tRNA ligase [Brevinematales bacterium]|nr:arginine--tRNA ligase [Brevinematales bacterium]
MNFKLLLKEKIKKSLKDNFGLETDLIPITYPEVKEFGDYATTVALANSKILKKSPKEIAEKIASDLSKEKIFSKIDIAGPGYINFYLSDKILEEGIKLSISNENYGKNDLLKDKNIILEYVSANPTGPLHIGHGRWAAIGDSIANLLSLCGAKVHREFYINDAGNQINLLRESVEAAKNGKPIPENGYHGSYIEEVAKMDGDPVQNLLEMQKKTLAKFRVNFDNYFSELTLHSNGEVKKTIEFLKKSGHCYELDGALWFKTTEFGDDKDRVLIKSDGEYTYFAVDIAYHKNKIERGFNTIINILGADHHGYVGRITAAIKIFAKEMNKEIESKILIGQLVSLFRNGEPVRMSKRTGEMITLEEVIDEIGSDASRYFLVMRKADTPLDFDIELAKKQTEENPVFYVQYAHARISGVLRNIHNKQIVTDSIIDSPEARDIAIRIIRYPEICLDAAINMEPHRITQYLEDLSAAFHRFYNQHRIITEDENTTSRRLSIILAVKNILKNGLKIIGVEAPEKM